MILRRARSKTPLFASSHIKEQITLHLSNHNSRFTHVLHDTICQQRGRHIPWSGGVSLSVRLSPTSIVPRRLNMSSHNQRSTAAHRNSRFSEARYFDENPTGSPSCKGRGEKYGRRYNRRHDLALKILETV